MAHGFESAPGGEPNHENGKDSTSKKDGASFSPRINRSVGNAAVPKFEQRLPFKPLGESIAPSPAAEKPFSQPKPERPQQPADERTEAPEQAPWRQPGSNELAARAAEEQRQMAEALHRQHEEEDKKPETSKDKNSDTPAKTTPPKQERRRDRTEPLTSEEWRELGDLLRQHRPPSESLRPAETADTFRRPVKPEEESFEDSMQRAEPELAAATSGAELHDTAELADKIPDDARAASDDEQFRRIVQQEGLVDPGPATLTERAAGDAEPAAHQEHAAAADAEFQDFMQRHPELRDLEIPAMGAEQAQATDDDAFREIARQETGQDPGEATWHEDEADQPSAHTPGGRPPRPPVPPVAEGGAWDDDNESYDPGAFDPQNAANEQALRNAQAPAGNILAPAAVLGGMSALEARRRLDNLRHTAREAGLAGAVGILGLGLVAEHFIAKRRDRKQQRQIDKHHKEALRTQKTLHQEQRAHQQTQQEVRRLAAERTTAQRDVERSPFSSEPLHEGGELAAALTGAAVATELARKKVHEATLPPKTEIVPLSTTTRRELERQIQADPQLALAVQKSRERQERAEREAALTRTEVVAQTSREISREQRRSKRTGGDAERAGGATPFVAPRMPQRRVFTTPSAAENTSLGTVTKPEKQQKTPLLPHHWTWGIVAFIAVAMLLIAFLR